VQKSFRNKIDKGDFLVIADLNNIQAADSSITLEVMDLPEYIRDVVFFDTRVKTVYEKRSN
jgi:hypothetical protein